MRPGAVTMQLASRVAGLVRSPAAATPGIGSILRMLPVLPRRSLLTGAAALGCFAVLRHAPAQPAADPFTLGVACGDPTSDGFVLWTRLAPRPLAAV